jgi:soluble lytic murein transglycosylase-like protein
MSTAAVTLPDLMSRLPLRLARWAPQLLSAQLCYGVDALLLAALMDRESKGGEALTPKGAGGTGDAGHGRGLMQIDDRAHPIFVHAVSDDGALLWKEPAFNILYAARLFAHDLGILDGDEHAAIAAYNCGAQRVKRTLAALEPDADPVARRAALDGLTTGRDYVTDVVGRLATFSFTPPKGRTP